DGRGGDHLIRNSVGHVQSLLRSLGQRELKLVLQILQQRLGPASVTRWNQPFEDPGDRRSEELVDRQLRSIRRQPMTPAAWDALEHTTMPTPHRRDERMRIPPASTGQACGHTAAAPARWLLATGAEVNEGDARAGGNHAGGLPRSRGTLHANGVLDDTDLQRHRLRDVPRERHFLAVSGLVNGTRDG